MTSLRPLSVKNMPREWRVVAYIVGGVLIGFGIGTTVSGMYARSQQASLLASLQPLRNFQKDLPLINQLIAFETPESTTFQEYQQLKSRVTRIIENAKAAGTVQDVSVYYRNQETGDWIGINQNTQYHPASLLKVPVMIAYFKKAESDPIILEKRIRYSSITGGDPFEAVSALRPGAYYTVRELIEHMIVDSDNGATFTLIDAIDSATLNEVYSDIGITGPGDDSSHFQIPTKTYALFFRILFNATYLTPKYSQEALELLAKAGYKNGLVAGIADKTVVAHKFGEHVVSRDRQTVEGIELHDCGIIYHDDHPYLLCVMTRASTVENAEKLIATISREIFETVKADSQSI